MIYYCSINLLDIAYLNTLIDTEKLGQLSTASQNFSITNFIYFINISDNYLI